MKRPTLREHQAWCDESLREGCCDCNSRYWNECCKAYEKWLDEWLPSEEELNRKIWNILEYKFNFGTSADYSNEIAKTISNRLKNGREG